MLENLSQDPSHPALQRFESSLPAWLQSTNDLSHGIKRRERAQALQCRYVELYPRRITHMVLDIDRPQAIFAALDCALPPPTLIVENPSNRHAHLFYELDTPVSNGKSSRTKPLNYLRAIQTAYTQATRADAGFTHFIAKNPLHPHWITHATDRVYSLDELTEYVQLQPRAHLKPSSLGRNSTLFESLRHWAYKLSAQAASYESLLAQIEAQAEVINGTFPVVLPVREIQSTCKSVAKFCWTNRHRFGQRVGVLGFTPMPPWLPAAERQAEKIRREIAGGDFQSKLRTTATDRRITEALKSLSGQTVHAKYIRDYLRTNVKIDREILFQRYPLDSGMMFIPYAHDHV